MPSISTASENTGSSDDYSEESVTVRQLSVIVTKDKYQALCFGGIERRYELLIDVIQQKRNLLAITSDDRPPRIPTLQYYQACSLFVSFTKPQRYCATFSYIMPFEYATSLTSLDNYPKDLNVVLLYGLWMYPCGKVRRIGAVNGYTPQWLEDEYTSYVTNPSIKVNYEACWEKYIFWIYNMGPQDKKHHSNRYIFLQNIYHFYLTKY
jgi:hypothetical protein